MTIVAAVAGGALAAILGVGIIFALWAPADLLAYDALLYTRQQLYRLTDNNQSHVPQSEAQTIAAIRVSSQPLLPKSIQAGGSTAVYRERRIYRSTEESSTYHLALEFRRI